MASKEDNLLSKALIEKGLLSAETLEPLLEEASGSKESLAKLLVRKNVLGEDEVLKTFSEALKIPFINLLDFDIDKAVIGKVPLKITEYYKIAPIRINKRRLTVAVSSPLDLRTHDDLRAHLGYEIDTVLARQKDIEESLKKHYGFAAGTIAEMMSAPQQAKETETVEVENLDNVERMAGDASIAKLVNQILLEAYKKRATDIHIEPYRGKVKLRYRIDGILYNTNVQPEINRFIAPILSRIKIMSYLNIVEKRLPQDGRAIVKAEDTTLDLRVSSIPTPHGESVVIRMLPMNRVFDLGQLGLNSAQLDTFQKLIERPHGVIFITGPTGSGKSTTLYACLNRINTDDRKIITIEDPIEYEMEGATQIQVASNIELTFARGLRSMLRHDPDVIMVGEVRDLETAEITIRVALTGHLVFSTLHTNDAASGVTRLLDIGVPPYLVASSVEAFIAQRLVRTICSSCKAEDPSASAEIKAKIARDLDIPLKNVKIYHGKGCNRCNFSGFWGRLAIYELLLLNEPIRRMIMKKMPASEIKEQAIRQGMKTLRQDGWQKVIAGLTTPGEIFEATPDDEEGEEEPGGSSGPVLGAEMKAALKADGPSEKKISDRRNFIRLEARVPIYYCVVKLPGRPEESPDSFMDKRTATRNLSAGGLLFTVAESLPPGAVLRVRIVLPDHEEPIETLARVIREEEIEAGSYEVAVQFLDISGQERQLLDKFIDKERR